MRNRIHRRTLRWTGVALLALGALPAQAQDAIAFATVDRSAAEVSESVVWTVEVLATAPTEGERLAWAKRVAALVPEMPGWAVEPSESVRMRVTGDVVEASRDYVLRPAASGDQPIPAVAIAPRVATPALSVRVHEASPMARQSARSVVAVVAEGTVDGKAFRRAGSAFLIGDDALVTAYHVVAGARRVVATLPNGRRLAARKAWALDPERDVAVLHVDAERARAGGLEPLALAPNVDAQAGVAFTGGWPSAPERVQAVTVGRRHADLNLAGRRVRVSSNPVRPGDSGGPLLDAEGRVLGVIVSGRSTDGDPDLLRQDVCLATSPLPAMRAVQRAEAPVGLRQALREAAERVPNARAIESVDGVRLGRTPNRHLARIAEAARIDPDDPVLQFLAGSILEEAGQDDQARRPYEDASRAGYFPAVYALAHHRLRHGDLAAADSLFAQVRASGAYAQLGAMGAARAFTERGRYREARSALDEVLAHDARFAPALYLLGMTAIAEGNDALARSLVVRLADRPGWARGLRLLIDAPVFRPAALEPIPPLAHATSAAQ